MFNYLEGVSKVMIVDLDAHQGNGHERDFLHDPRVHILDCYNKWIYPNDHAAKCGCGLVCILSNKNILIKFKFFTIVS